MSTYRVKSGHDVALGSLTVLDPQPRSAGVQYARRSVMPDGSVVAEGPYVELVWDVLESETAYQALMLSLGVSTSMSIAVTVYARSDQFAWVRYNGHLIRPVANWNNYFARNTVVLIRNLEVAT